MINKKFWKLFLNRFDTILAAFLGAILGISYYLNPKSSDTLLTPLQAFLIILFYFGFSVIIRYFWLED